MRRKLLSLVSSFALLGGFVGMLFLAGCLSSTPYERGGSRASRNVEVQASLGYEDDYDYYPSYEIYYSRNHHEYVYRDGNQWLRNSEPRGVSLAALQSSPFVRVDFRDSPARHHAMVVRSYPKNWRHPDSKPAEQPKDKPDSNDRKDDDNQNRKDNRHP